MIAVSVEFVNKIASIYWRQGKYAVAEPMFARAFAASLRANGAEHRSTLGTQSNLANVQFVQGRYAEAEAHYTRTPTGASGFAKRRKRGIVDAAQFR